MKLWTRDEEQILLRLRRRGDSVSQVAEVLSRSRAAIAVRSQRLGATRADGRHHSSKHSHLRKAAMTYYLTHSFEETAKRFELSHSEFKSLLTGSYRDPALRHLRKDGRRRDAWSVDEILFLLRASGIQPRAWIAKKLGRGTLQSVKEQTERQRLPTRYVNGIPLRWTRELLGIEDLEVGFKVKAGPTGRHHLIDCRPILVPWIVLDWLIKRLPFLDVPDHIVAIVDAMKRFQLFIHGTRGVEDTVHAIQAILSERDT